MKRVLKLLRFCGLRALTLVEIALKFCLFLPIPLFMVWFSYKVDISGLFQGELAPREVANMLLAGDTVSNYEQMDERQILALYVQNLPETEVPETVALGSSRVMQLSGEIVGGSYYNAGMSGASAMDVMNAWYLFERAGKLPENLILCVDPWLFNGVAAPDLNKKADVELFAEFLEKSLGINSDYQEPDTVELWKALVDPAYFQGNVQYYLRQRETGQVKTEDGETIPFKKMSGSLESLDFSVKFPDGSIYYPASFRNWTHDEAMAEVLNQAGTISAMHGFDAMDPYWTDLFERFVQHVQSKGVNVVFLLTPYHPFICLHVYNNPQGLTGFFEVEPWLRQYAQKRSIPLYGSYHAGRAGVQELLFFDGIHCRPQALSLMFPGIAAAVKGERTVYETLYMQEYGSVQNTANALIGYEANCVVPDEAWYKFASTATPADLAALEVDAALSAEASSGTGGNQTTDGGARQTGADSDKAASGQSGAAQSAA